jgi:hypothetical protein
LPTVSSDSGWPVKAGSILANSFVFPGWNALHSSVAARLEMLFDESWRPSEIELVK